ncbi:hypothetical protein [Streptomyces sp. RLB3-6]|uniref:hypothetical protein n=1 Tax=Streptomyces sp. RLB3-6 TaxID=2594457 RepID=UPI001161ECCF|nr:hypothetical protein [Streptomyces sp. RLB3-6]QDN84368.1 hypothetical protein FNV61_00120 [Streptomyces sp. RLB3-6]
MFEAGDEVEIVACEADPRMVGKKGHVIDEAPPFNGRWAVHGIPGILTPNSIGCYASELRKTGRKRT